jgi:hypothetical protein
VTKLKTAFWTSIGILAVLLAFQFGAFDGLDQGTERTITIYAEWFPVKVPVQAEWWIGSQHYSKNLGRSPLANRTHPWNGSDSVVVIIRGYWHLASITITPSDGVPKTCNEQSIGGLKCTYP